ncbi:MAG: APC family permease [Opitutales bacterium]|nr:APC family permease [Opitutales bacterium]
MNTKSKRVINVFSLAMINFAAIANVRNLPTVAPYGFSMLFFYLMAAVLFLIPTALVSAELASTFTEDGGIYSWVSHAIGDKMGFLAILLQNIGNFVCFPMALSFVASTIAYGIFPSLVENRLFIISTILLMIWVGTLITLRGMQITGIISTIGSILGTFLPALIIVGFGMYWLFSGRESQIVVSTKTFLPDISGPNSLALILGLLLSFSGFEMSANHVRDVENPRKNYPRAILLATIMILFISIFGSLAIAIVIPKDKLAIHAGTIQALSQFFAEFHIEWLTPVIAIFMTCGSIAWFCAWVSGPPRALYTTTTHGYLPKIFHKLNKHGMPVNIMLFQALVSTALAFLFVFAESIGTAFVVLTNLASQFALLMYILMFTSAIVLKFKYPNSNSSAYHVPGGKIGMIILSGIGLLTSAISYLIGFFPPNDIGIRNPMIYTIIIIVGNLLIIMASVRLSKRHFHRANA